ncbi:MAG: hypothetical protein M3Q79_01740 [bacterium]|nr:hypothetical protein [bacterium]
MYSDGGYANLLSGLEQARLNMLKTDVDSFHIEPRQHVMSAARHLLPGLARIAGCSPEVIEMLTGFAEKPLLLAVEDLATESGVA